MGRGLMSVDCDIIGVGCVFVRFDGDGTAALEIDGEIVPGLVTAGKYEETPTIAAEGVVVRVDLGPLDGEIVWEDVNKMKFLIIFGGGGGGVGVFRRGGSGGSGDIVLRVSADIVFFL